MSQKIDKTSLDVSAIFLVYTGCCGDTQRTALAMDLSEDVVRALATQEKWVEKLKRCSLLGKSDVPGAYEKSVNRSIQLLQGHAIRSIVQRVLDNLSKMNGQQLLTSLAQTKAGQVQYSGKFLAELSQAAERANYLCLNALGDTVSEREQEREGEGELNMSQVHSAVMMALNSPLAAGAEQKLLETGLDDLIRAKATPSDPD